MGFLDNSADIILDACLTDTGRFRLAKGDGSFKGAKFALSDDEIVYTAFNKDPASNYRNIEAKIPFIKNKNKNFMNKLHNLNMSADFWWALTGEYAILAEHAIMLSGDDPRLLNDLKNIPGKNLEASKEKVLSSTMINSIGRESILDKNS